MLGRKRNCNLKETYYYTKKIRLKRQTIAKPIYDNTMPINDSRSKPDCSNCYFNTIKKLMYAYGDCYTNNNDTVLHLHCFINNYLIQLNLILLQCDYKKTINHLFSYEYERLSNCKRMQKRNSIMLNQDNIRKEGKLHNKELDLDNDDLNIFISDDEDNNNSKSTVIKKGALFNFDNNDDSYAELIAFQNERTEKMNTEQYLEYTACLQYNFLSEGKKKFKDYIKSIIASSSAQSLTQCSIDLINDSNLDFIAFLLKETIKTIIQETIRAKQPSRQLFLLFDPLSKADIQPFLIEEIDKLVIFYNDLTSDPSLAKAFKRKAINTNNSKRPCNKNVRIKQTDKGIFIIIKKYILIENTNDAEQFKSMKLNAEIQALNSFLVLRDKYVGLAQEKSKLKNRSLNTESAIDYSILNFTINTTTGIDNRGEVITVRDLITYLGIDNYYEYFLVKDYLSDMNLKEIKPLEIEKRTRILTKVRLKTLTDKFNDWIKMSNEEQHAIINEFNALRSNIP